MCIRRAPLEVNILSHSVHGYTLSRCCPSICSFRLFFVFTILSHMVHCHRYPPIEVTTVLMWTSRWEYSKHQVFSKYVKIILLIFVMKLRAVIYVLTLQKQFYFSLKLLINKYLYLFKKTHILLNVHQFNLFPIPFFSR